MGITAENLAEQYQVSREAQDTLAVRSQNLEEASRAAGRLKEEIAPVTIKSRKGEIIISDDEYIRTGVNRDSVSAVRPAFKKDGPGNEANEIGRGECRERVWQNV